MQQPNTKLQLPSKSGEILKNEMAVVNQFEIRRSEVHVNYWMIILFHSKNVSIKKMMFTEAKFKIYALKFKLKF